MNKTWFLLFFITLTFTQTVFGAQGRMSGEQEYTLPNWFKLSFLEIREDINEAKKHNKHVMLFMHIDRCPYCTRMLEENFNRGHNKEFIQKYFDVIALNIKGSREIVWDEKNTYSEKTLARALKVHNTPTMVFLNEQGHKVYQMNGYRKPSSFKHVLNYVKNKKYLTMKMIDYIQPQNKSGYILKPHPLFRSITDFSNYKGPTAIIFEDKSCEGCDEFHKEVLQHKDVIHELEAYKVIRLDAYSTEPIIDVKGNKTTTRAWAKELNLDYRPGTILFDKGEEITRSDGRLYHFHFKELLRYVSTGSYKKYPTYLEYLGPRQKEILNSGVDIDFSK